MQTLQKQFIKQGKVHTIQDRRQHKTHPHQHDRPGSYFGQLCKVRRDSSA